MRQIGSIEERQHAERFVAYLIAQGIPCSFDGGDSAWKIWIQEEDDVDKAREELTRFRNEPDHQRYRDAVDQAATVVREHAKQAEAIRRRTVDLRDRWRQPSTNQGPITFGLMALMVVIGVITGLEPGRNERLYLLMTFAPDGTMNAIWSGEVWRLITPILMHKGIMHFLFNMMALRDLGLLVESRVGSAKFLGMVLLIAAVSNSTEYVISHRPFVGMSGVIYGLFGYAWVRGRLDPSSGLWLPRNVITYIMGWYILCFLVIPGVANWVHTGGLVMGALLGTIGPLSNYIRRR